MKNFIKLFLFTFCIVALGIISSPMPAFAIEYIVTNVNYSSFGLSSEMFNTLCTLSNTLNDTNRMFFDSRLFCSSGLIDEVTGTSEEAIRIKSDIKSGLLNLSHGNEAYDCIKNLSTIPYISKMNNMFFNGIRSLNLDGNSIDSIGKNDLSSFTDLRELNARDNDIYSFDMGNYSYGSMNSVDLSNNSLAIVNLSCMATGGVVDLSNNYIENVSDMTFGEFQLGSINLGFNNLTSVMNIEQITTVCSVKPIMNVQGLNRSKFVAGDEITVYNDDDTTGLAVDISYHASSSYSGNIVHTSGNSGFSKIIMPAGKLYMTFSYDNLPVGCDVALITNRKVDGYLPKPTYYTTFNGVTSKTVQYNKDFTVTFECENIDNVPNKSTILSNQVLNIYSGKKLEGNVFNITRNGSVSFSSYVSFDSIDSEVLYLTVTKHDTTLITIGIIIVLAIVIFSISGVSLYRFFKDGGQVAPLNSREIQSIRRHQNRKYGNEYDFDDTDGLESASDDESGEERDNRNEPEDDDFFGESDEDSSDNSDE